MPIEPASGQVGRTEKNAVYAVQHGNRARSSQALNLHPHADLRIDRREIVKHRAVAVAALRHQHAANALRRVTRGGHCAPRIVSAVDKRDQEVVKIRVQQALDFIEAFGAALTPEGMASQAAWQRQSVMRAILCRRLDVIFLRVFGR